MSIELNKVIGPDAGKINLVWFNHESSTLVIHGKQELMSDCLMGIKTRHLAKRGGNVFPLLEITTHVVSQLF